MKTDAASVEGYITEYGAPVANKTVIYSWGRTETGWRHTTRTTTTSEGYYSFPESRSFHPILFVAPGADYGYHYSLAMGDGEMERTMSARLEMEPRSGGPRHLTVNCELDDQGEICCETLDKRPWETYSRKMCIDGEY
jgi:hypothetical protein